MAPMSIVRTKKVERVAYQSLKIMNEGEMCTNECNYQYKV